MRVLLFLISLLWIGCKPAPSRPVIEVSDDSTFLTGTFFVVRHAEGDSALSAAGRQRSGALYNRLKDSFINKIYITSYLNSSQTADSLRLLKHIDTSYYEADTSGESLIYQVTRHNDWGKRILVIGHSHTIIPILRSLKVQGPLSPIPDSDFGRIYRVKMGRKGSEVTETCYP
jgi:hypothetical protein